MTKDRTIVSKQQVIDILEDVKHCEMTIEEAERRLMAWCEQHAARCVEYDRMNQTFDK